LLIVNYNYNKLTKLIFSKKERNRLGTPYHRCPEKHEEKASRLRGSAGGITSREPLVLSQKKDRRSRGEYTLCTTKVLARARGLTEGRGGRGRERKAIGKIRRNCAPVDTPAPVSWK